MNDSIIDMFSIPAGVYRFPEDSGNEYELVKNLNYVQSSENTVGEDKYLLNRNGFETLRSFCLATVNDYWQNVLGYTGELDISLSWANCTKPNQSHHRHYHSNSIISGSFYFSSIAETPITFLNPFEKLRWYDVQETENNRYNAKELSLAVDQPSVIVFPSYIDHYVKINNKSEGRYSIAFNSFFTEPIGSLENATYLGQELDKK